MVKSVSVNLDTSALFAGIWSSEGGARMILKLGEAGAIQITISSQVLREIENALRKKAPQALGALALTLDRCNAINLPEPSQELVDECNQFVHHPGDAIVLAAAWKSEADYFITLDRRHFIENKALREAAHFYIGTPGDFLDWFRGLLISADRNN